MSNYIIKPAAKFVGHVHIQGDKSISHRAIMLSAIANGETIINNFLPSKDCLATVECLKNMGIEIKVAGTEAVVKGRGLKGLEKPGKTLYAGNSGTTIRLLSGILAGQDFESEITGDDSIQKRPMQRIVDPLSLMGAKVTGYGSQVADKEEIFPPLRIKGSKLKAIEYKMPIASAQVKSAIILAGLFAEGETKIIEPSPSRDHTERMLSFLGGKIHIIKPEVSIVGGVELEAREIFIPADISSAAYFIAAGVLIPKADVFMREVGVNPTRTGLLEVLHRMGAGVEVMDEQLVSYELRANLAIKNPNYSVAKLNPITIEGGLIPRLIDEIPIIAVLATQAEGSTYIKDAKELRVKESDRITSISAELKKMGANISEIENGMKITGPTKLKGAKVQSFGDHRIAMSLAIAGLIAEGETQIENTACIDTSFPGFFRELSKCLV